MKTLRLLTILFGCLCLNLGITQAQTRPTSATVSAADVVPLSARQPFPFAFGVGIAMPTFQAIQAKLRAGEALRLTSRIAIDSLSAEITYLTATLADRKKLAIDDDRRLAQLSTDGQRERARADTATARLITSTAALDRIRDVLPRRYRKQAGSPAQIADLTKERIETLEDRPIKWAGGGAILGALGTLVLLIL